MKIVVVSDTHIPSRADNLPEEVLRAIGGADLVLHAGDYTNMKTVDYFLALPEFIGVWGNMDSPAVKQRLKEFEIVELEGLRIGITHGWGEPGLLPARVQHHFEAETLDVIIFGHSHSALNKKNDNVLLFNPGSPTDTVFAPFRSFGILNPGSGGIQSEIVKLNKKL